ncbi:YtpI family protein [Bacillus sp. REN16]|uniref:YtpI family protein n=1 Tax=Bacillus sp. REN16 TaxID=2887296 RepID=UPI001E4D7491|nr:YtpI family protein [Bacillus sp. REN16]MCC3356440.1 YtpI family protein [Bacillus sp. REN16]
MKILVMLIIFALVFYFYYKTKYFRTRRPIEKQWLSAKSSMALGLFVALFGLNTFFVHPSTISTVIGFILVLVGGGSTWAGFRAYKHYQPLVMQEAKQQ